MKKAQGGRDGEQQPQREEKRREEWTPLCSRLPTFYYKSVEEERGEGSAGDRAPRSSPVGNRFSGLCSEMDVNPLLYRRLDRTSGCCCW